VSYGDPVSGRDFTSHVAALIGVSTPALMWSLACLGLVIVQWIITTTLLKRHGIALRQLKRLEGFHAGVPNPPAGDHIERHTRATAPTFSVRDSTGRSVRLQDLRQDGKHTVLLFIDPTCQNCSDVLTDVELWRHSFSDRFSVLVVSGTDDGADALGGGGNVYIDDGASVSRLYGIHGFPAAVLIHPDGSLARSAVFGHAAIADLVIAASTGYRSPLSRPHAVDMASALRNSARTVLLLFVVLHSLLGTSWTAPYAT